MAVLATFLRSEIDHSTDIVRLDFEDNEGNEHHIPIQGGAVGALLFALLARLRERSQAHSGRTVEEQPLQLVDASALSFEDRKVGLLIQCESNLRFPFVVNRSSIARLRSALSSCDELMNPSSSQPQH